MAATEKGGYRQINKSLNISAFDAYLNGQVANLAQLPNVEQVTPLVLRLLGQNPGRMTLQGSNTFVVGSGTERILIDTSGGEPEYAELLETALAERGIRLKYVLVTHWHGDHCGGVPDLLKMYPHLENDIYKNDPEPGQQDISDGQVFRVEGATVTAVHAPGHSHDHMVFVLQEEKSMFTGDNILGTGTSAVEHLGLFMSSLQKMDRQNCVVGHPGHGLTIDNLHAKITQDLKQKWRREDQILKTMERLRSQGHRSLSVKEIVTGIYGDTIDEETRTLALEPFANECLRKMAGDGKVAFEIRSGRKKWLLAPRTRNINASSTMAKKSPAVTVLELTDVY